MVKTLSDVPMDNKQATAIVAGLFMGEAHFSLRRDSTKPGKPQISTEIGFTNQDPSLIDYVCAWLDTHGIAHFIHMVTGNCYAIRVGRHGGIKKCIDLLEPFLMGKKLAEARILRRFVMRRLERGILNRPTDERRYDDADYAMVGEKLAMRESSETTRFPRCWDEHRHYAKI